MHDTDMHDTCMYMYIYMYIYMYMYMYCRQHFHGPLGGTLSAGCTHALTRPGFKVGKNKYYTHIICMLYLS